jgi:dihydrofolate synthase/folylpolyglutamate synthase
LAKRLAAQPAAGKTHAVLAMMADKDRRGSLEALRAEVDHWWLADLRSVARAASLEQLNADLAELGLEVAGCGTVATLIERLMAETSAGDRIVIMGSFYTVAAALQWLDAQKDPGGEQ